MSQLFQRILEATVAGVAGFWILTHAKDFNSIVGAITDVSVSSVGALAGTKGAK